MSSRAIALRAVTGACLWGAVGGCTGDVLVGMQSRSESKDAQVDAAECIRTPCRNQFYQCGDCIDNDSDGVTDMEDVHCVGPCDNAEDTFYGSIPGQSGPACTLDCYFDANSGSGDDGCLWSHSCDPLSVAPDFPPEGMECAYDPETPISAPGMALTCDELTDQSQECVDSCLDLTPNGCDCFGCCEIVGAPTTVWLGSLDQGTGETCTVEALDDPLRCRPCTQVASCLNPCDRCERCPGKLEVPSDCED